MPIKIMASSSWVTCQSEHIDQVIPPAWLRLFSAPEFNQLLAGGDGGAIDVADMRAHTSYSGGYSEKDGTVCLFWKVCVYEWTHSLAG